MHWLQLCLFWGIFLGVESLAIIGSIAATLYIYRKNRDA